MRARPIMSVAQHHRAKHALGETDGQEEKFASLVGAAVPLSDCRDPKILQHFEMDKVTDFKSMWQVFPDIGYVVSRGS